MFFIFLWVIVGPGSNFYHKLCCLSTFTVESSIPFYSMIYLFPSRQESAQPRATWAATFGFETLRDAPGRCLQPAPPCSPGLQDARCRRDSGSTLNRVTHQKKLKKDKPTEKNKLNFGRYYMIYCRASHTSDAIRVMYSSVSGGVVHVLCACAQVQSTV
jgi:hypothetical protein